MVSSAALVISGLKWVVFIACGLTAGKLLVSDLYRRYQALFFYLVFRFFYTGALLFIFKNSTSQAYLKFFILTSPIIWLFYVLIVIELYTLVLEKHRGLYTLGRWALYACLTISVLISGLTLLPQLGGGKSQASHLLSYYYAIERGVDFSLLIFLVLILLWLTRYPVPLSRNVIVHSLVYFILFLSSTMGLLARVIFGLELNDALNAFFMGVGAACILIWLFFLTRKGEEVRVSVAVFGPEHEQRILDQLDALNKTLLKASRH